MAKAFKRRCTEVMVHDFSGDTMKMLPVCEMKQCANPRATNSHLYNYGNNNPVKYTDPDGRSPNKKYAGTVDGLVSFMNNLDTKLGLTTGNAAHEGMLRMGKTKGCKPANTAPFNTSNGNRYIYTQKGGWIDMAHFMFYAGKSYSYRQKKEYGLSMLQQRENSLSFEELQLYSEMAAIEPEKQAIQLGLSQEIWDCLNPGAHQSAFSYEDLPTDKFGADFGANYFNPNSEFSFAEQVKNYLLNVLGATNPYNAPNYNSLPDDEPRNAPEVKNKTTQPLYAQ